MKSEDCSGISMNIIKKVITNIVKPLTYICSKSSLEGCFPYHMKISKVMPILWSVDNCILCNYRPISMLPQFSKKLEKLYKEDYIVF